MPVKSVFTPGLIKSRPCRRRTVTLLNLIIDYVFCLLPSSVLYSHEYFHATKNWDVVLIVALSYW
jgi:hypothetical protein